MKTIAFIGLDGSGKSTQAKRFVRDRTRAGDRAAYNHQFRFESNRVVKLKNRIRPLLLRWQSGVCEAGTVMLAPQAETAQKQTFKRTATRVVLIPPIVALVLIMGWWRTIRKGKRRSDLEWLVLDRYFYDELVRIEWKLGIRLPGRKLLLRLVRHPDKVFYFDIPAAESWKRMDPQDSSQDAMARKECVYKEWLPSIGALVDLTVIPVCDLSIEDVGQIVDRTLGEENMENLL